MDEVIDQPDERGARIELLRLALHGVCAFAADAITRELQANRRPWAGREPPTFTRAMMVEAVFDAVHQHVEASGARMELSADEKQRLLARLEDQDLKWRPPSPP